MKKDMIDQFTHFWKVFALTVRNFHGYDWRNKGEGLTRPDRLAYHILKSTRYYVQDESALCFDSGRPFELEEEELRPSQQEILSLVDYISAFCTAWLEEMPLEEKNRDFPWAGDTRFGVALFLMRHGTYHLGEMEGILNETQFGKTPDLWIAAMNGEEEGQPAVGKTPAALSGGKESNEAE